MKGDLWMCADLLLMNTVFGFQILSRIWEFLQENYPDLIIQGQVVLARVQVLVLQGKVQPQLSHINVHVEVGRDLVDGVDFLDPDLQEALSLFLLTQAL